MTTALKAEMAQQTLSTELATTPVPVTSDGNGGKIIMQNFGDAEPVLDGRGLFEYGYCPRFEGEYGGWYEYPYDIVNSIRNRISQIGRIRYAPTNTVLFLF